MARVAGGLVALSVSLALVGVPPAPAQPRDEVAALGRELVYGGDAEFPPYEYLDARGQPAGLNVDLVRAIARRERLQVRIDNHDAEGRLFGAGITLERRPLDRRQLGLYLRHHPWITAKVLGGIYVQALKLSLKRIPYVPHPGVKESR